MSRAADGLLEPQPRADRRPAPGGAPVVALPLGRANRPRSRPRAGAAVAVLVAVGLATSPLWSGFYDFTVWCPLALAAVVLLVLAVVLTRPSAISRTGLLAGGALVVLLALSGASMLWAESKEGAWTATNQLALYVAVFAIGLVGVRRRVDARVILAVLGAPALIASLVLAAEMVHGGGEGWFLAGRLNAPIGYINGTAGLLLMGVWSWLGLAHAARRAEVRALALAGATVITGVAVLTQSRSVVLATSVATICVLAAAPRRTGLTMRLLLLAGGIALSLHWTLAVYRASGTTQGLALHPAVMRPAGLAILVGGVLAGAGELVLTLLHDAVPTARRALLGRVLGGAIFAAAVTATSAACVLGAPSIRRQFEHFRTDRIEQAAPDRFLDAGGFRYDLWRVAAREFLAHPVGGLGAGGYDDEYYRLRRNPQSVLVPHSLELQMAAELGVGGLVALLVFCGTILAAARRRDTLAAADPMVRIAAVGMFTAWLAATSVDWLYNIPGLSGSAFLAAALLLVPVPRRAPGVERARPPARRVRVGLVVGLAALAVIAASLGRQYAAVRDASAGADLAADRPVAGLRLLRSAHQLDPFSLPTLYDIAAAYARLDDYGDARATLLLAHRREPENYVPLALLGDLAMRRGDLRMAASAYRDALRLDPHDPALSAAETSVSASAVGARR